jgi:hypothetical protein
MGLGQTGHNITQPTHLQQGAQRGSSSTATLLNSVSVVSVLPYLCTTQADNACHTAAYIT